jgi:hypothetical protein
VSSTLLIETHQRERARLATATARVAGQAWRLVDSADIRRSWAEQLARVLAALTAAQLAAAQQAEPWIRDAFDDVPTEGQVVPEAFAGVSSDGRALAGLLMYPAWRTLAGLARGLQLAVALASGAALLDLLVRTQVTDAGRAADSVAMTARPVIVGYERIVNLPACARCIVLAGRLYRWSTGFPRHPRCDCVHKPVTREQWRDRRPENTPERLFEQMTAEQRRKAFGEAGVRAIEDGADISQVVNARRGMQTATAYGRRLLATTEGTTRRGRAGKRLGQFVRQPGSMLSTSRVPRLMPEEIYRQAENRDHAIHLLRVYGFIA